MGLTGQIKVYPVDKADRTCQAEVRASPEAQRAGEPEGQQATAGQGSRSRGEVCALRSGDQEVSR